METTQRERDWAKKQPFCALSDCFFSRVIRDADELARLRLGVEEHIKWLRNEAGLHPSPAASYLQADKLEGLLNSGDGDGQD